MQHRTSVQKTPKSVAMALKGYVMRESPIDTLVGRKSLWRRNVGGVAGEDEMPMNFTAHIEALAEESGRWRVLAFVDHVRVLLRFSRSVRPVGVGGQKSVRLRQEAAAGNELEADATGGK